MNYQEAIDFMYSQLPAFHRIGKAAYKANLDNTLALDEYFDHPHHRFRTIHVAGTNGKGSVSHMLASVLQSAGYKTGLYTSPHLKDYRERLRINGQMAPEEVITRFIEKNSEIIKQIQPSFFEMSVAMAFDYFAKEQVDIAVVEVGLGGRLDSTNIISPELSIITGISYDHTDLLGGTLEKIAGEKAGIIKPGIPVVIGRSQPEIKHVFEEKASEQEATIHFADQVFNTTPGFYNEDRKQVFNVYKGEQLVWPELAVDLQGFYQSVNLLTVLQSTELLQQRGFNLSEKAVREGLSSVTRQTGMMGRWQVIGNNPLIVCDTGHNEEGISRVVNQLLQTPWKRLHMVIGFVQEKSLDKILALLPREADYYFTQATVQRALDASILAEKAKEHGLFGKVIPDVKEALEAAKAEAGDKDMIFVGGSTFVVVEVL
jgi:dihydrofolate synthase/folylpolyglutamate synthase